MCGIVGYVGRAKAAPIILDGLKRLEYRGYDSAGVAVVENGTIQVRKEAGKIAELEKRLEVRVEDSEKRDLYTLADVVGILSRKLELRPVS